MSQSKLRPPGRGSTRAEAIKNLVALLVVLGVIGAVIVLILAGHLAPAIAVTTVGSAGTAGVYIARRLLGRPATRLGPAVGAAAKGFLSSLLSSHDSQSSSDHQPEDEHAAA